MRLPAALQAFGVGLEETALRPAPGFHPSPPPPHTLSDFQWAFHRLNVPLIFVEVDGGKLGRLLRQWRCALRPPRSRRPALGGPSRSLL